MATQEENELLTRTGPGTPMGNLLRQYWLPVLLSSELERAGRAKRVRLLGEDLVAFRSPSGKVGLLGEGCSHRRASLYFGRNEEDGLRCAYHGWKYGFDGRCLDQPNQVQGARFKDKVRHPAYPCAERGEVIWTYMGPAEEPPPLPDLEWALVPDNQRFVSKFRAECNWLQAMEGGIDPSHVAFLHAPLGPTQAGQLAHVGREKAGFAYALKLEKAPCVEALNTAYGVLIGAGRNAGEGQMYWRITQFHLPFHTMPPPEAEEDPLLQAHIWVPMDDEHMINWCISWHATRAITAEELEAFRGGLGIHIFDYAPATPEPYGDIKVRATWLDDYGMDWELHRTRMFFGVPGVGAQDRAIQESQGTLYDRTQEHIGAADIGIVRVRRRLLEAALALREDGTPPPGRDAPSYRLRPAAVIIPKELQWSAAAQNLLVTKVRD